MRRIRWDRVAIIGITPMLMTYTGVKLMISNQQEPISEPQNEVIEVVEQEELPTYTSLGEFKITYYCGCEKCGGSKSASGKDLEVGMIATDKMFPFGTELYFSGGINGLMECYVVEDRGGAIKGNRIDVYVEDHHLANQLGVVYTEVFVKN